jgi:hypothetical protein
MMAWPLGAGRLTGIAPTTIQADQSATAVQVKLHRCARRHTDLAGDQAGKSDESKELAGVHAAPRFSLEAIGEHRIYTSRVRQRVGSAINQGKHVVGRFRLYVAVAVKSLDPEAGRPRERRQPTYEPAVVDYRGYRRICTRL